MLKLLLISLLFSNIVDAQIFYQPTNMSFESGGTGEMPPAWEINSIAEKSGFEAFKDLSDPFKGRYHAVLQRIEDVSQDSLYDNGALYQRIDALAYRGYKIKFQAALKSKFSDENSSVYLFIEIKSNNEINDTIFINLDNPLIAEEWKYFSISADIPSDANHIKYGVFMKGLGSVKIDDATLDIIQPNGAKFLPPTELSEQSVKNLYSLAKAYGYTRFFYPGENVKKMNWDKFMIKAVEETENISDSLELIKKLNELFSYPAPLSEITASKEYDRKYIEKPSSALGNYALAWMHAGAFAPRATEYIYSTVHNVYNSLRPREAAAFQVIDAIKYRNKKVTVTADIKTENLDVGSGTMLWLRADNEVKSIAAFESSSKFPAGYSEWTRVQVDIDIPNNADLLRIGAVFVGEGIAYFDNFMAVVSDGDTIELKNAGFENGEQGPLQSGWIVPGTVKDAGYNAIVQSKEITENKMALRISSSFDDRISFPEIGKINTLKLGNGLFMHMPSVLYADSTGTLPRVYSEFDLSTDSKPNGFYPTAEDRTSRLAIALMAWSVIDNFSLRNISESELYEIFNESIKRAAKDKNQSEFLLTLRNIIKYTRDSQARVWYENDYFDDALPILIENIDNKLFVSKVHSSLKPEMKPGIEIIEINNKPAYSYISELASELPSSTKQWSMERAVALFRSGKYDSEVKFKFMDYNNNEVDMTLKRNIGLNDLYPDRLPEVYEIDSTMLYLDITILNDKFFKQNIAQINEFDNIILDARGTADISEHTLGLFIQSPILSSKWEIPVYTFPDKSFIFRKEIRGIIKGHNKLTDKKVVILTDERSIGYIEGILHIAQQYEIATLIGRPSAGMPGDVLAFRLPGNYNFSMTIMRAYAPDGKLITGKPVTPDIEVYIKKEDLLNDIDPILKTAIESFDKK